MVPKYRIKKLSPFQNPRNIRRTYALLQGSQSSSSVSEQGYTDDGLDSAIEEEEKAEERSEDSSRISALSSRILYSGATARSASRSPLQALQPLRVIFDHTILILGFICIVPGVIVFRGSFISRSAQVWNIAVGAHWHAFGTQCGIYVFNGLTHLIKEGIFFWDGLLTFRRWLGCPTNVGWAWNRRPSK